MFSNNNTSTNSIIKGDKLHKGYVVYSNYYNLPKKRVLFLTHNEKHTEATLKIFSMNDLNTSIIERTIKGEYRLLGIFSDGTILLKETAALTRQSLVKICSTTLNTLSTQPLKDCGSGDVIDNDNFFVIRKHKDWNNPNYFLIIYTWNKNTYEESREIPFTIHPKDGRGDMGINVQRLEKNRYACQLQGHNTDEFGVLIFEIDSRNFGFKELGVIRPKAQHGGAGSAASGDFKVLSNDLLLTYHSSHDNVQIWDTKTLNCIKEWNWAEIQKPKNFEVWCLEIIPFPDSIHLLVHNRSKLFLCDMDKLVLKQIQLTGKSKLDGCGNHHILANGQVLAFFNSDDSQNYTRIVHFDVKEMVRFREKMNEYKLSPIVSERFFKSISLPKELANSILEKAFTSDAKEIFVKKAYDDSERENEKINCRLM